MVHIVPSISFLKRIIMEMESGFSVSSAVKKALLLESTEFANAVEIWWMQIRAGHEPEVELKTHNQKYFLELLKAGVDGSPILDSLQQLESEMEQEFERQWKLYLESLPFKLSLPLLFFFFPSYVILLFGPLLTQFLMEVAS